MKKLIYYCLLFLFVFSSSCEERVFTPKPKAYPKIEFPQKSYANFQSPSCSFSFDYPVYAKVELNQLRKTEKEKCWFDVYYKPFDARLHLSYYDIENEQHFSKLLGDAFQIADKINARSNFMDEMRVQNENGVGGLLMDFTGKAASPMQFFLTDSTSHFLKAALYFNTKVNPDSIAPISEFVKEDVAQMINSFKWK